MGLRRCAAGLGFRPNFEARKKKFISAKIFVDASKSVEYSQDQKRETKSKRSGTANGSPVKAPDRHPDEKLGEISALAEGG
jgi:hypothetical protein